MQFVLGSSYRQKMNQFNHREEQPNFTQFAVGCNQSQIIEINERQNQSNVTQFALGWNQSQKVQPVTKEPEIGSNQSRQTQMNQSNQSQEQYVAKEVEIGSNQSKPIEIIQSNQREKQSIAKETQKAEEQTKQEIKKINENTLRKEINKQLELMKNEQDMHKSIGSNETLSIIIMFASQVCLYHHPQTKFGAK